MNRVSELIALARLRTRKLGPRAVARILIGTLVAANVITALVAFKPWAGTVEEMEQQAAGLRNRIRMAEQEIARLQRNVAKVEGARADGDRFLQDHIMSRHTLSSTLVDELAQIATKAGIRQKGIAFSFEPVEGTENLTRAVVTGEYEGSYSDLVHFVSLLDRSPRFLIIESLSASPQQNDLVLNVSLKLDAFVRDEGAEAETVQGGMPQPHAKDAHHRSLRSRLSSAIFECGRDCGRSRQGPHLLNSATQPEAEARPEGAVGAPCRRLGAAAGRNLCGTKRFCRLVVQRAAL